MKQLTIELAQIRGGYREAVIRPATDEHPLGESECYGSTPRTIAGEVRDLIVAALTTKKEETP